jgi:hypothetical protein
MVMSSVQAGVTAGFTVAGVTGVGVDDAVAGDDDVDGGFGGGLLFGGGFVRGLEGLLSEYAGEEVEKKNTRDCKRGLVPENMETWARTEDVIARGEAADEDGRIHCRSEPSIVVLVTLVDARAQPEKAFV